MALGTQVVGTQGLKLIIAHEATLGDGGLNSGASWTQLPILSPPSILDLTAPLSTAPQIFGKYTQGLDQSAHERTNQIFEISFSVLCTPEVLDLMCLFTFEDGDGSNTLSGNYSPPSWENGVDTDYSATIFIGGGGYGSNAVDEDDIQYKGCIAKSLELTHAVDSESGKPIIDMTFVTGFSPVYTDAVTDGSLTNVANFTGGGATDFTDWADSLTYIDTQSAGFEVHPYSYSVSLARDIQRVGCLDYTNFEPFGYVMVGGWDISMNMIYKRDENFSNILNTSYDSGDSQLRIGNASGSAVFDILCYGKISEATVDTGSPELRNSITIKGMRDISSSNTVVLLSM